MENVRNGAKSPIKKSQSVLKVRFVQYGPYRRPTYKLFFLKMMQQTIQLHHFQYQHHFHHHSEFLCHVLIKTHLFCYQLQSDSPLIV